jgi:hypothetical protein
VKEWKTPAATIFYPSTAMLLSIEFRSVFTALEINLVLKI